MAIALGSDYPLLAAVESPADIKKLDDGGLRALADEIRTFIIESVTRTGGHLGAGLGVVELTLALFAEFDFNQHDKLVWDVGHQCYPHKIVTGRAAAFDSLRQAGGLSGFPDPAESEFDTVKTGHGGTSISTAVGLALAWRAHPECATRKAVAVIGDGSLQEGNAYEALNHGGTFKDLNLVVVLNDNNMSISPSVGAMSGYLSRVRSSTWLQTRLRTMQRAIKQIPGVGSNLEDVLQRWYHSLQGILPQHALGIIFEEFGFFYYGPIDGHDVGALRRAFRDTRWMKRPVLIHVVTTKGRGYKDDEPEITCYHAAPPSAAVTAQIGKEYPEQGGQSFTAAFAEQAIKMAERDPRLVVITAAMLDGTGLTKFQQRFPERCFDVGMAEQHAVAMAAGLALAGYWPICAIYSTFLQRAYDQVFQEVALQKARVLFCLDRGGLVGSDGATHNGVFDIGYLRCLPNFALMAPRDAGELGQMMELAASWDGPVAIRFPRGTGAAAGERLAHRPFGLGQAERVADGSDGCILAYGPLTYTALDVRRRIQEQSGQTLAVVNARFVKPLDEQLIREELERQPVVFTLEDHALAGGFGSAVAEFALTRLENSAPAGRLQLLAVPDRFIDHGDRTEQLAEAGLDIETLTSRISARVALASPAVRPIKRVGQAARR
ncbi:MAG: 1-deoxy-D-xylulose-5-phosphate synthase [Deltaproteobacteria bacterium]|nr:1-deoxy-D-xylulose-5-phosphate synthase [Deltaproteobacteria bacterium]